MLLAVPETQCSVPSAYWSTVEAEPVLKNIKVVREDVTQEQHPEPILAQAPEREQDFFVVPVIIEK